jgi:CRISPR-associated protein Cmr2
MIDYRRKLYALLHISGSPDATDQFLGQLGCFASHYQDLNTWWHEQQGDLSAQIASTSDRINLIPQTPWVTDQIMQVRHPISGQNQQVQYRELAIADRIEQINVVWSNLCANPDLSEDERLQRLFWWCWRFYPEQSGIPLLTPAHAILPDNSIHSYSSAVAALTGALFPKNWQGEQPEQPYLLLFTFSPVQEFIKASRKFLDFWAGSYLLHYLSAFLCWTIAQEYSPDAIITPSLWGQEIMDAFLAETYPEFKAKFIAQGIDPVTRFDNKQVTFLSTAGFPNTITVLVPGKEQAQALGEKLTQTLKDEWIQISQKVRKVIRDRVRAKLDDPKVFKELLKDLDDDDLRRELNSYKQESCWEWKSLWEAQINHTWEPYFVVVPLGNPEQLLSTSENTETWWKTQNEIAQPRISIPTAAEVQAYDTFNVGTWWGSYQARLGQLIQAAKNTRNWQIPVAPGERSSLSGQFSAIHPRLNYTLFPNGRGMSMKSMQLFWKTMAIAFPGLFNGTERLNALELTKRMAWQYGGVAEELGIQVVGDQAILIEAEDSDQHQEEILLQDSESYEHFVRFPNLTSIAMANFAANNDRQIRIYWRTLAGYIKKHPTLQTHYRRFCALTRRPSQIPRVDQVLVPADRNTGYNGVMFSAKWLADDLGLKQEPEEKKTESDLQALRNCVNQAHLVHFGESSPSDWWVLVLGDGDNMGKYVSGIKLKNYKEYVPEEYIPDAASELQQRNPQNDLTTTLTDLLSKTKKRMGPATHIGLNRALIDFSNRLVPYLTEERCCGRVIYSGGDDVMVALPLADLPKFLRSLRAAWSGAQDPYGEFIQSAPDDPSISDQGSGYWQPNTKETRQKLPDRPLFTMGNGATMSLGVIVAHKSVPLPTVLENLWEAEKERAKKMPAAKKPSVADQESAHSQESQCETSPNSREDETKFSDKDGLGFRVIYGSGNILEALMKGHLLEKWWRWMSLAEENKDVVLAPVLYRLSEELPKHCEVTEFHHLFKEAARVIIDSRDAALPGCIKENLLEWIDCWEQWAWNAMQKQKEKLIEVDKNPEAEAEQEARRSLGTRPEDLANLLRFSAFWVSRRQQELNWG